MKTLVIDRKKWNRGNPPGQLLNNSGTMCCLGFECKLRKFTSKNILRVGLPSGLGHVAIHGKRLGWLTFKRFEGQLANSIDTKILANINDDTSTTDEYKEKEIIRVFAQHGRPVVFIN